MYSSAYNPQDDMNVAELYKKEVIEIAKNRSYCGLWQLARAASILRRPVMSIYPEHLSDGMCMDFNRKCMCVDNRYNTRDTVKIMWTSMQVSRNSYPVHFVPLLKAVSCNT